MEYRDILSKATVTQPNFLWRVSPLLWRIQTGIATALNCSSALIAIAKVRWIPLESRELWKFKLMSELSTLAQLPVDLDQKIDRPDLVHPNLLNLLATWFSAVLQTIWHLSWQSKKLVFQKTRRSLGNFYLIRHYANREEFRDNPKLLLAAIHGLSADSFNGVISASIQRYCINFYIEDDADYFLITGGSEGWGKKSWGFFGGKSQILDLQGCITHERGTSSKGLPTTLKHEERHAKNKLLQTSIRRQPIKNSTAQAIQCMLEHAKDEIIAYMTDESEDAVTIFLHLFLSEDQILYDYRKSLPQELIGNPEELEKPYNDWLWDLLEIAFELKTAKIPNLWNLLAITPAKNWKLLKSTFLNPKWHVKHRTNRAVPYYFDHFFRSIDDENSVLKEMYNLAPDRVVRLIYEDPNGAFSITERFGSNEVSCIKYIPSYLAKEIKDLIYTLHANSIVHGDLLGNILFSTDKNWVANWFKLIDPLGVSAKRNRQFFEPAKQRDLEALASFDLLTTGDEETAEVSLIRAKQTLV
jgi:hypothetical protein